MSERYPPGPPNGFFGLSNIRKGTHDVLGFYTDLVRQYGDFVYLRLGPYRDYVVYHPDLIREVLVTKAKYLPKMSNVRRVLGQWNGNGLLLSEGDTWLRQRRLVQPAFSTRRFAQYCQVMAERTERLVQRWKSAAVDGQLEVDVDTALTDLTLEIIAKTLFNADVSAATDKIGEAVAILSEVAVNELQAPFTLPDWLPQAGKRRKRWAMQLLDETIRGFIRAWRAKGEDQGDLLSMLLMAVDEEGDGGAMTDEQARDESMNLFLAGHDTTAAGLTWVCYNLAKYPAVAQRVAEEADRVLTGRTPTFSDIPHLAYTEHVIKESLRLFPPAIGVFVRQAAADIELGGYPIRKGSLVQVFSYVVHRDPRWFPNPERFDPERFAPGRVEQIPPYAYVPFGGGPRVCIGERFSMVEMTLVVAMLMQHFSVAVAPSSEQIELLPRMSLRPKGGLRLIWSPRVEAPAPA